MAYGIKYTFTFNSLHTAKVVKCDILENGYVGTATTVDGAGRSPVIVEYENNDTFGQPVVGGKAVISMVGDSGFNLSTFSTTDDKKWKCIIYIDSVVYFTGFLLSEEAIVPVLFGKFPFSLAFTDQVGLLSDKKFTETVPGIAKTDDLSLARIIAYILRLTGLELDLAIYCNTWPSGVATSKGTWLDDVYVLRYFTTTDENEPKDCYTILSEIMLSMGAQLVQANGRWNVVCQSQWADFQSTGLDGIDGGIISYDLTTNTADVLDTIVTDITAINRSQLKRSIRPIKSITNTFNYKKPVQIENIDLNTLGTFVSESTVGTITTKVYALSGWSNQNSEAAVMKVQLDDVAGVEIDRWIEAPHTANDPNGATPNAVVSNTFFVEVGDRADFSIQYASTTENTNADNFRMSFFLDDLGSGSMRNLIFLTPANPQLARLNWNAVGGSFSINNISAGLTFNRLGTANAVEYSPADIISKDINDLGFPRFPFNAEARLALQCFNNTNGEPNLDAKIKGIKWDYQFFINDTNEVIGQKHTISNSSADTKSSIENDVFIDDSPRFLAKGTMYKIVSGAKVKTTLWSKLRSSTPGDFIYRFSEFLLRNEMLLRGVQRDVLEGQFKGLLSYTDICNFAFDSGRYYSPNRLSVDLKNEQFTGEFYEVSRTVTTATVEYNFNYIFNTKK